MSYYYNEEQLAALHKWAVWNKLNVYVMIFAIILALAGMGVGFIGRNFEAAFYLMVWSYVVDGIRERYDSRVVDRTYNKVEREGDDVT